MNDVCDERGQRGEGSLYKNSRKGVLLQVEDLDFLMSLEISSTEGKVNAESK